MCSYTITIKENGQEWDSLQYPGNCFKCNKNKNNQTISMNVLKARKEEDFDSNELNVAKRLAEETKETVFSPRRTKSERKKEVLKNELKGDKNSLKDPDPTDKLEEVKTNDEVLIIKKDDIFSASENFEFKPGFFTFSNLKQGEKIIDRYKQIPGCFNSRISVIDKVLNILATYWGKIDTNSKDESEMWWRTSIYDKALNLLLPDEMSRTILYGKVLQKAKSGPCNEVVLMNSLDEICLIHNKTIRNSPYDDGGGGKKKLIDKNKLVSNEGSNRKRRFSAVDEESNEDSEENSQKPVKEFKEDELIEEH